MRITKYTVELTKEREISLVKEESKNYPEIDTINSPENVCKMMNWVFKANVKAEEHSWIIALDTKINIRGVFEVSHGTINGAIISPREIFTRLCLCGAVSFIMVHNHPSGDVMPSYEDIKVTSRLKEAGTLMGIELVDHIIIGNDDFYSMRQSGLCGLQ